MMHCSGFQQPSSANSFLDTTGTAGAECGSGLGTCITDPTSPHRGRCECGVGTSCGVVGEDAHCPGACIFNKCQNSCGGTDDDGGDYTTGKCDRYSGYCMCNPQRIYNGPDCESPARGMDGSKGTMSMTYWGLTFDKWGWSICPAGSLLVGMATDSQGSRDALYNIMVGHCQEPYSGQSPAASLITRGVEPHRCYHENWWKKFDSRGGKFCRRNYFVAGLFRSHCNSLYCIEMAKCCSVKRSVWINCAWKSAANWITDATTPSATGTGGALHVDTAGNDEGTFIVGFFRSDLHTLAGITHIRQCTPIWWGQMVSYKSRFS